MKIITKLLTVSAFLAVFALPTYAQAQKIATANMQRILNEIKEVKELEARLKTKLEDARRQQESLQAQAKEKQGQRDQYKPDSPEYNRVNNELVKIVVEAQIAGQIAQQELVREQKRQLKAISEKIVAQVKVIAEAKQIAIVVAQVLPPEISDENWEKLTTEQASNLLSARNLLYVTPDMDLTTEVITSLDAAHAAGQ